MNKEIFPEVTKPTKKRDYYTTIWINHMFALQQGLVGFRKRKKFSTFLNEVHGGGRNRADTNAIMSIIDRKGRKPFIIKKDVPGFGEIEINLDRIQIISNDKHSSFWIQYGNNCGGFFEEKLVTKIEVTKKDHIQWLKENSYEDFMERNATEKTKKYIEEGYFKNPKVDKLLEIAKAIRLRAIGSNCDV